MYRFIRVIPNKLNKFILVRHPTPIKVSYTDHHSSHKEDVIRTSISYDFHVGGFGVAPTLALDFVDGETATVIGVAFIKAF